MEITQQPILSFLGVNIVNIQYNLYDRLDPEKILDFEISPKVYFPEDEPNAFSIFMFVRLKYENVLNLEFNAVGNFLFSSEAKLDLRKGLINANAPAIMFPYIRSFISTITSNLGTMINPVILPPHFFNGEIEELVTQPSTGEIN
jgi:preprotein translocase subunit SecB